ncbi:MAG: homoserine dehydrogenase [Phycisphaerae bacterium]|nr:MAG: homoserine dehydrogenase [Phycisphaerae bacterium]
MSDVKTIRVALAGCGTVGGGVAEIVINRGDALAARTGLRFEVVKALVSDASKKRDVPFDSSLFTDDPNELAAADVDMVVEVMGGTDTARDVVLAALSRGVPVVTANKALLAHHGAEIYETARNGNTCIAFEASCAGGLPIIGALLRGLLANRNTTIMGIFNSTCNYILTQMLSGGASYEAALRSAQESGYAEADPTLDVGGGDTAHKLTILASLAFGLNLDADQIPIEGIDGIELVDLQIAEDLGFMCKMLGIGRCSEVAFDPLVSLRVHPTLLPYEHELAFMDGTSGAVLVMGDVVGKTFYSGAGAGSLPTASAVVADMVEVASGAAKQTFDQVQIHNDRTPEAAYFDAGQCEYAFYIRVSIDQAGCSAQDIINKIMAVETNWQHLEEAEEYLSVIGITGGMSEGEFLKQLDVIQSALSLKELPTFIRMLPRESDS